MPNAQLASGIALEYDTFGDPADPTLLLVNGYTSQMIAWDAGLLDGLVAQGLHVVIYDNRDVGLSTKLDGQRVAPMEVMASVVAGTPVEVPYTLSDMAADGMGLLDALEIEQAHIAGVSMGGMIVQTMAIEHPQRITSMTSIMSAPGDRSVGQPSEAAIEVLLSPPATEREAYINDSTRAEVWMSNRYFSADAVRQRAGAHYDRMFYPEGFTRQLAAIYASGDRSDALRQLDVPALVIHGRDDELIAPSGGERTAELIPGSRYLLLADMGHDLPAPLIPVFCEALGGHARTSC